MRAMKAIARSWLGCGMIAVELACGGCTGAQQQPRIMGQAVHQQVAIVVRISDQVNDADNAGGVAVLVEGIEAGLKEHGMWSEVYTARDDNPPPPRIELNVVYWSERSKTAKDLGAAGTLLAPLAIASMAVGPANRMVVDCAVMLSAGEPALFSGRIDVGAAFFGGSGEASAGAEAAAEILAALFKNSPAEAAAGAPVQSSQQAPLQP